ncbi:MAG: glutamate-5-semialdehyde dehydrogenase [Clostridiaceae bacterium]|nr:glutamate-5-semialdehyde dehydrogenase [Clostridiaceae bacterium]
MRTVRDQALAAKAAARVLAQTGTIEKNRALYAIADALDAHQEDIFAANARDADAARENGMRQAMLDRLTLTPARLASAIAGVREIALQEDPVGSAEGTVQRPNGLRIEKRRVPLGVVGIIYEARPNVTVDAAALCLKSGNACVLRGGKEAIRSNTALMQVMRDALTGVGLPADAMTLCEDTSRESANEMMAATGLLDVLIPRGGAGLIRSVVENARVPVIETGTGICHVYADAGCDWEMAVNIIRNAKCSRPSVCNAAEDFLVHASEVRRLLPRVWFALRPYKVELRCDERSYEILKDFEGVVQATEEDFETEFSDYILAVKVVNSLDEAIEEITLHGTGHSECIVTENYTRAKAFTDRVDAAAVYVNASTRFTDGGEFGLGAEIGISTQKLHARGPMGAEALTSVKYVVCGNGQIRE